MEDRNIVGSGVAASSHSTDRGGNGGTISGHTTSGVGGAGTGGVTSRIVPVPSIGRIVHYHLTAEQSEAINRRREHSDNHRSMHAAAANGTIIHVGNKAAEGDTVPMLIVKTWGPDTDSAVNGQAFLDGNDTLWITSAKVGEGEPGTYSWPQRQ